MKQPKKTTSMLLAATTAMSALVLTAAPASAATSCTDARLTKPQIGFDLHRARTTCNDIQVGYKVRAKLVRDNGPDYTSSWFVLLNTYHYTGYYTCYSGCYAAHEVAPR